MQVQKQSSGWNDLLQVGAPCTAHPSLHPGTLSQPSGPGGGGAPLGAPVAGSGKPCRELFQGMQTPAVYHAPSPPGQEPVQGGRVGQEC